MAEGAREGGALDTRTGCTERTRTGASGRKSRLQGGVRSDALAWHKVSLSSGGEFSPSKVYNKTRSNVLLFSRHARPYHWLTIPFFGAGYLVWLFVKGLAKGDLKLPGAVFRALTDMLRLGRGAERCDRPPRS
jgi:hypothetical protein